MAKLRELGKDTVAVYAVVTPSKIHLLLVTADIRKAADFAIRQEDLNHRIEQFRSVLQNPRVDPRPMAREFYQMLVAPIARDLERAGARTILWSLDDKLRYVPMAALFDGESYLVERYRSVVYTPAGRSSLADPRRTTWTALGVGVSHATAGFSPLPAVTHELESIIRSGQGDGVLDGKILLDDRFTKDAFLSGLRHETPVVHIASHFQLNPGNDNDSFLLMGDGSQMTLGEVRTAGDLFRDVDLLTLSACSTALASTHADGTEIEGFGVLAERQGAKAVVAGLWSVADASTSEFMRTFYEAMVRSRDDKAEALRQSQLTLLYGPEAAAKLTQASGGSPRARGAHLVQSAGPAQPYTPPPGAPWAHPYFWAPFILIGNPR
jgi:CHAT domain-containing protein